MLGIGEDALSIYLNDHLAGSTVGTDLARRVADNSASAADAQELGELADQIAEDRETLISLMRRLSVQPDPIKSALSWGAAKAAWLKLNASQLLGSSAVSRLEEIETLSLGVEGKLVMWEALRRTHGEDPRLRPGELDELIARARSQRSRLQRRHPRAADEALRA